ncbi:MAG: LmbE family protein [Actinomycetia bacterium]|jgi:LmbE family N-acetylglucosaminyl deacetylase|nr:LmbE family protein [Actinomycetes bacterium]
MIAVAELGTILGVWAHPDDDIYLSAGLMAAAVVGGQRVVDVTATRGEGGSMDEERWPPESMGDVRTNELLRSLDVLGVQEHHFLEGPVDIDMDTGLDQAGAEQVRRIMEEVDPDTVLTFGPEGMTGHVAHQDVSRWAGEAFETVARAGARLFHAVFPKSLAEEWLEKLAPFDIFRPGTPNVVADEAVDLHHDVEGPFLDQKVASIKEHASQIEALYEVFGDEGFRRFMSKEAFVVAATKGA